MGASRLLRPPIVVADPSNMNSENAKYFPADNMSCTAHALDSLTHSLKPNVEQHNIKNNHKYL